MNMRRLFVIGNGFDLAHHLPTKYEDFHQHLLSEYPNADAEHSFCPECSTGHHGEDIYGIDDVVGYLITLISRTEGENWSQLEQTLGELDFDDDFSSLPDETDEDGDPNPWHEVYNNEDMASNLSGCVPMISNLFSKWIDSIEVSAKNVIRNPVFATLASFGVDVFLSFNYTMTLENIYNANHVCHIHGMQGDEKLWFGHGAGNLFDEDHFSRYIGSEDGLESIQDALRKDTAGAIHKNEDFFQSLSSGISEIYFYGFSFGDVDLVYLRKIFNTMDTNNVKVFLNNHNAKYHMEQKELIQKCGFRGLFDTYNT